MAKNLVRISLMVKKDQHNQLLNRGINISGYIRDLIDDNLDSNVITLAVDKEIKGIYDQIISTSGEGDKELQPYIKQALKKMLADKIKKMQRLHESIH